MLVFVFWKNSRYMQLDTRCLSGHWLDTLVCSAMPLDSALFVTEIIGLYVSLMSIMLRARASSSMNSSWISIIGGEGGPVTAWIRVGDSIRFVLQKPTGPAIIPTDFGDVAHRHAHEHGHQTDTEGILCHHESSPAYGGNHFREPTPLYSKPQFLSASALQAEVREVMRSELSSSEKAVRIHAIFLSLHKLSLCNLPGIGARAGCDHYERMCWIRAECCGKYYPCRRCHDEAENHEINRAETKLIACTVCGDKDQPLSPTCRKCGVRFARRDLPRRT